MTDNNTLFDIVSPCIGDCTMNTSTTFCNGCYRTVDEIEHWGTLSNTQKKEVVQNLHDRRSKILGVPSRRAVNRRFESS